MKTKKLKNKLSLNKETTTRLSNANESQINGGLTLLSLPITLGVGTVVMGGVSVAQSCYVECSNQDLSKVFVTRVNC